MRGVLEGTAGVMERSIGKSSAVHPRAFSAEAAWRLVLPVLLGLIPGFTSCRSSSVPPPAVSVPPPVVDTGRLGPGDIIEVAVFQEPDLTGLYRLEGEGVIDFPLVGDVEAIGKTPLELQNSLKKRLENGYLVSARVRVMVKERNSQKVHILGAVNKPTSIPFEPNMTIIQAIAAAGGMSDTAQSNGVTITRVKDDEETSISVRVGSIQSGQAPNVYLHPGDIVFVREAVF